MTRIKKIHDAATTLFLRQGYAQTQVSHIAGMAGIGVGTVYKDFAGKEEIRDFVLKCTITPGFIDREFERPISAGLFTGLEEEIVRTLRRTGEELAANLGGTGDGYGFEDLVSDAFDLMAKYAAGCLYIEKNFHDCGGLAGHYRDYRKRFFETMTRYMELFVEQGAVRPLDNVALTTNLIIEMLSWWAMDMRYIAFEPWDVPLDQAKAVCLDNLIHAYQA